MGTPDPAPLTEQRAWSPTGDPCPRCGAPLNVRAVAALTHLHQVKCLKCGWHLDLQRILTMLRHQDEALAPPEDGANDEN